MLAGSVRLCFGDRAEKSSGGHGTHGEQEHPAVPAALCPQREGERWMIPLERRSFSLSFTLSFTLMFSCEHLGAGLFHDG